MQASAAKLRGKSVKEIDAELIKMELTDVVDRLAIKIELEATGELLTDEVLRAGQMRTDVY